MAKLSKEQEAVQAEQDAFEQKRAEAEAVAIAEREVAQKAADAQAIAEAEAAQEKAFEDVTATENEQFAALEALDEAERVAAAHAKHLVDAEVQAQVEAALPKQGPDVEGQGDKAQYIVCLGYPLYHPFQNKLVGQDGKNPVTLKMDYWVRAQLDARLIQVAPDLG